MTDVDRSFQGLNHCQQRTSRGNAIRKRDIDLIPLPLALNSAQDKIHAVRAHPLTPPDIVTDGACLDKPHKIGNATPTNRFSPPTPDITPPHLNDLFRQEALWAEHSASSRAESFKTALEALTSDDDLTISNNRQMMLVRQNKETQSLPFWTSVFVNPHEDQTKAACKTNGEEFDSFGIQRINSKKEGPVHGVIGKAEGSQISRMLASDLKESRRSPSNEARTEPNETISDAFDHQKDSWRHSGSSLPSTIEAFVIDFPPRRRQNLRHTGKAASLRSVSAPVSKSVSDAGTSSSPDRHRRLQRKVARISNQDRGSVSSDISATPSANSRQAQAPEIIPVVVIPERSSSLRDASRTRSESRARSRTSSRRPKTAPDSQAGSIDTFKHRRLVSEPASSSNHEGTSSIRGRSRKVHRKQLPQLSLPTHDIVKSQHDSILDSAASWHNSDSASAQVEPDTQDKQTREIKQSTSEKYNSFEGQVDRSDQQGQKEEQDQENVPPRRISIPSDPTGGQISPSLVTPFLSSVTSQSPGPIEINEARAVPFFYHNNASLVVVDQVSPPRTATPSHQIKAPRESPESQVLSRAFIDSPLRNPRCPPQLPTADGINVPHTNFGHLQRSSTQESPRKMGSVRRVLGSLSRSETFSAPFPSQAIRPHLSDKDLKLRAFWRPRPFWDDSAESEHENDLTTQRFRFLQAKDDQELVMDNSFGTPRKRAVFQNPMSFIRRVANRSHSRSRSRPQADFHAHSHTSSLSSAPIRPLVLGRRSHQRSRSELGEFQQERPRRLSLHQVQERVNEARDRRAHERLEIRRQKIRESIGPKYLIDQTPGASRGDSNSVPL